jgi:O-antigen ligase
VTGALHSGYLEVEEFILLYVRNPIEYLPLAALMVLFLRSHDDVKALGRTVVLLIVIVVGFLGYQVVAGVQTGADWGGIYRRFGSVFGSPNDMGLFCAWAFTALVAFWNYTSLTLGVQLLLATGLLWALALSVSASAVICAIVGVFIVMLGSSFRQAVAVALLVAIVIGAGIYYFNNTDIVQYARERFVEPFSGNLDRSQEMHLNEPYLVWREIQSWSLVDFILGSPRIDRLLAYNPDNRAGVENYYFSLLLRSGIVAPLLFIILLGMTWWRAFQMSRTARGTYQRLMVGGMGIVAGGFVAFAVIPYPDVFPSNFFFWFVVSIIWSIDLREDNTRPTAHVSA